MPVSTNHAAQNVVQTDIEMPKRSFTSFFQSYVTCVYVCVCEIEEREKTLECMC